MVDSFKPPRLSGLATDVTKAQESVVAPNVKGADTRVQTQQFLGGLDSLIQGASNASKFVQARQLNNDAIMARTLFEQNKQLPNSASRAAEATYDSLTAVRNVKKFASKLMVQNKQLIDLSLNARDDQGHKLDVVARGEHYQLALQDQLNTYKANANLTDPQRLATAQYFDQAESSLEKDFLTQNAALLIREKSNIATTTYSSHLEHLALLSDFRDTDKFPKKDDFLREFITTKDLVNMRTGINESLGGALNREDLDKAMLSMAEDFFISNPTIDPTIFEDLLNTPMDKESGVSLSTSTLHQEASSAIRAVNKSFVSYHTALDKRSKDTAIAVRKSAEDSVGLQLMELRLAGIVKTPNDFFELIAGHVKDVNGNVIVPSRVIDGKSIPIDLSELGFEGIKNIMKDWTAFTKDLGEGDPAAARDLEGFFLDRTQPGTPTTTRSLQSLAENNPYMHSLLKRLSPEEKAAMITNVRASHLRLTTAMEARVINFRKELRSRAQAMIAVGKPVYLNTSTDPAQARELISLKADFTSAEITRMTRGDDTIKSKTQLSADSDVLLSLWLNKYQAETRTITAEMRNGTISEDAASAKIENLTSTWMGYLSLSPQQAKELAIENTPSPVSSGAVTFADDDNDYKQNFNQSPLLRKPVQGNTVVPTQKDSDNLQRRLKEQEKDKQDKETQRQEDKKAQAEEDKRAEDKKTAPIRDTTPTQPLVQPTSTDPRPTVPQAEKVNIMKDAMEKLKALAKGTPSVLDVAEAAGRFAEKVVKKIGSMDLDSLSNRDSNAPTSKKVVSGLKSGREAQIERNKAKNKGGLKRFFEDDNTKTPETTDSSTTTRTSRNFAGKAVDADLIHQVYNTEKQYKKVYVDNLNLGAKNRKAGLVTKAQEDNIKSISAIIDKSIPAFDIESKTTGLSADEVKRIMLGIYFPETSFGVDKRKNAAVKAKDAVGEFQVKPETFKSVISEGQFGPEAARIAGLSLDTLKKATLKQLQDILKSPRVNTMVAIAKLMQGFTNEVNKLNK